MQGRLIALALGVLALLAACGTRTVPSVAATHRGPPRAAPKRGLDSVWPATVRANLPRLSGPYSLDAVQMSSPQAGWAWGWQGDTLFLARTTDGGAAWTRVVAPPILLLKETDGGGIAAQFLSVRQGWIAALVTPPSQPSRPEIVVYRTTDGAGSWQRIYLAPASPVVISGGIAGLDFISPQRGWMLGLSSGSMGQQSKMLFATTDGGSTWQVVSQDAAYAPNTPQTAAALPTQGGAQVTFLDAQTGWAALGHTLQVPTLVALYRSVDGGARWSRVYVPVAKDLSQDYTEPQVPVFSGLSGTLVVQFGGNAPAIVTYLTRDGGRTWQPASRLPGQLLVASFPTPESGTLFAAGGQEWRTSNGGGTWRRINLDPVLARLFARGMSISSLQMVTPSVGWMVLVDLSAARHTSVLLRTTDGGLTWQAQAADPIAAARS